jgi:rod shape-determining protein MreD
MTKGLLALLMGLAGMAVSSVLAHRLGLEVTRIELDAVLVVYACISLTTMQAALCSFAAGYLFDLMSGNPTGLYAFVAMLTFMLCRIVIGLVDVRGGFGFAALCAFIDAAHQLLAYATLSTFSSRSGGPAHSALLAVVPTALLTGLVGLLLYPLFHKLDLAFDREESSLLR